MESSTKGTSLWKLNLQSQLYNYLLRAGVESIEDLVALSPIQLIQIRGIGFGSYHRIIARLEARGYDTAKFPRFEKRADFYMGGPTWGMGDEGRQK